MADVDAVVVGAGPGGLFAAARSARLGARVLLVEAGPGLEERIHRRAAAEWGPGDSWLTTGFGGAGLFSDGKICLSPLVGSTVSGRFPVGEVTARQAQIDAALTGDLTVPLRGTDPRAANRLAARSAEVGMEYIHYPVRHFGTEQLPRALASFRRAQLADVEIACRTSCTDVVAAPGGRGWKLTLTGQASGSVSADHVVLAPGKVGAAWLGATTPLARVEDAQILPKIGFRVEGPQSFLAELTDVSVDPKLIERKPGRGEVRTHCVCFGGDVVEAKYADTVLVGGHSRSYGSRQRSNTAVLVASGAEVPDREAAEAVAHRVNAAAGGKVAVQRLAEFLPAWPDARPGAVEYQPSIPHAVPVRFDQLYPRHAVAMLREFLADLAGIAPGLRDPRVNLYGPIIERWSNRYQVSDQMEAAPGLFLVGDGPGLTGGIVGAAETGWIAGEEIARRVGSPEEFSDVHQEVVL